MKVCVFNSRHNKNKNSALRLHVACYYAGLNYEEFGRRFFFKECLSRNKKNNNNNKNNKNINNIT